MNSSTKYCSNRNQYCYRAQGHWDGNSPFYDSLRRRCASVHHHIHSNVLLWVLSLSGKCPDVRYQGTDLRLRQSALEWRHIALSTADNLLQLRIRATLHIRRTQVRRVQAFANRCRGTVLAMTGSTSAAENASYTLVVCCGRRAHAIKRKEECDYHQKADTGRLVPFRFHRHH